MIAKISEATLERIDVFDVDVLKSKVFELHCGQLKNELRLAAFFLESHFFDLAQDKGLRLDGVETESSRKFETALKGNDSSFENVATCKATIDL